MALFTVLHEHHHYFHPDTSQAAGHAAILAAIQSAKESIMSSLDDLQARATAQGELLATQGETITNLRTYVTSIEQQVRDLASGEVLSATAQAKVDAIIATIDANAAKITENTAGAAAAGDGDITT